VDPKPAATGNPASPPHSASAKAVKPTPRAARKPPSTAPRAAAKTQIADQRTAPAPAPRPGAVGTAVQAAAELTEIGLMASARALRGALARLPRP
jgi:hypothetical protein